MLVLLEWCAAFVTWFLVRVNPYWRKVEPFLRLTILVIITLIVTFWVSVFSYLLLYYFYVPIAKANKQLNFKFSSTCKSLRENTGIACSFPKDNVSLFIDGSSLLSFGQSYKLFVVLEVPESKINREIGMFMVGVNLYSKENNLLQSQERSMMLEYKSELLESIDTILFSPFYLLGNKKQKQEIRIEMFSNLIDNLYDKIYFCEVTIFTQLLHYYSGNLQLYANFGGIRSLMFYYPFLSAFVFVTIFFLSLNFLVLINWLHRQWVKLENNNTSNNIDWVNEDSEKNEDEDFWPEPRPCAISGQEIIHRNYRPNVIENIGENSNDQ